MLYWIILGIVFVVIIAGYTWLFLFSRKRQRKFDEQYVSMKERHEIFVLNKKVVRERPKNKWLKYAKFKTYQVTGRVSVSQSVRGVQMSRMQTVTFHTAKTEYEKIQVNHKYKMDIAGNYIGNVVAPAPVKTKPKKSTNKAKASKDKKDQKSNKKSAKSK